MALARQLQHAGSLGEAAAVLEEAERRFPLLPRIPVEQAGVARAAGDGERCRRALERAVSLSPGWPEAVTDLAGLLQNAGEHAAELAVLERALRHAPGEAVLHGWRADALRLSGREAEAREELERALRLDPGYEWAWDLLVLLCSKAGQPGRPRELAGSIARERPLESRAWVLVARATPLPGERLAALDRAVEAWPRDLAAWELRVDALAELGRFDEALAATRPPALGAVAPRSLRLRAIRLDDAQGRREQALSHLRALLREEPDQLEAWQVLADWEEEAGNHAASLAATDELVRLAPHRSVSHGFRGHALLLTGARQEGKAALRRAVELNPSYTWALQRLLDAEIEDGEEEAARRTLALVERRAGEGAACLGRLQLASRLADLPSALAALRGLAHAESGWDGAAVSRAFERTAGWPAQLDGALASLLLNPSAVRGAGALWATRMASRARWRGARTLARALSVPQPGPAALGAAAEWLERLAGMRRSADVRRFVRRHAARLRPDPSAWGSAGYALCNVGQHRRAVAWLSDWRGRDGLRGWMLLNLAQSLRDLRRVEEAAAVNRAGLELPEDHTSILHRVHLAVDAALSGGPDPLDGAALPEKGYYRWLAELSLALRASSAAEPRQAWRAASPHLRLAHAPPRLTMREPYLLRVRQRALWRIARRRGGLLAPFWFLAGLIKVGG